MSWKFAVPCLRGNITPITLYFFNCGIISPCYVIIYDKWNLIDNYPGRKIKVRVCRLSARHHLTAYPKRAVSLTWLTTSCTWISSFILICGAYFSQRISLVRAIKQEISASTSSYSEDNSRYSGKNWRHSPSGVCTNCKTIGEMQRGQLQGYQI